MGILCNIFCKKRLIETEIKNKDILKVELISEKVKIHTKIVKNFKNYISILIFFGVFLSFTIGVLYQYRILLENGGLAFFSWTQVISDGVSFSVFLYIILFLISLTFIYSTKNMEKIFWGDIGLLFILIGIPFLIKSFSFFGDKMWIVGYGIILFFFTPLYMGFSVKSWLLNNKKKDIDISDFLWSISFIFMLFLLFGSAFIKVTAEYKYKDLMFIIKDPETISKNIKEDLFLTGNEIKYINDKYIFGAGFVYPNDGSVIFYK